MATMPHRSATAEVGVRVWPRHVVAQPHGPGVRPRARKRRSVASSCFAQTFTILSLLSDTSAVVALSTTSLFASNCEKCNHMAAEGESNNVIIW